MFNKFKLFLVLFCTISFTIHAMEKDRDNEQTSRIEQTSSTMPCSVLAKINIDMHKTFSENPIITSMLYDDHKSFVFNLDLPEHFKSMPFRYLKYYEDCGLWAMSGRLCDVKSATNSFRLETTDELIPKYKKANNYLLQAGLLKEMIKIILEYALPKISCSKVFSTPIKGRLEPCVKKCAKKCLTDDYCVCAVYTCCNVPISSSCLLCCCLCSGIRVCRHINNKSDYGLLCSISLNSRNTEVTIKTTHETINWNFLSNVYDINDSEGAEDSKKKLSKMIYSSDDGHFKIFVVSVPWAGEISQYCIIVLTDQQGLLNLIMPPKSQEDENETPQRQSLCQRISSWFCCRNKKTKTE